MTNLETCMEIRNHLEQGRIKNRYQISNRVREAIEKVLVGGRFSIFREDWKTDIVIKELQAIFHNRNWDNSPVRWFDTDTDGSIQVVFVRRFEFNKMSHIMSIIDNREKAREEYRIRLDEKINSALEDICEGRGYIIDVDDKDYKSVTGELGRIFSDFNWPNGVPVKTSNAFQEGSVKVIYSWVGCKETV